MMNLKMTALAVACALVLSACGNSGNSSETATPASTPPVAATAPTQAAASMPMAGAPEAAPASDGKPTAVVTNCSTEVDASDMMQYDVSSIVVPASCTDFTITLTHSGKLPVAAMGHDLVIAQQADIAGVDADGAAAGLDAGYLKANDSRVIAHTRLIGGGESTSVTFAVSKIQGAGPYEFFCSFPGHSGIMHGSISVK